MEFCVTFKALLTRLLFAAFGILCIWRVYKVHGTTTFWVLMLAEVGLLIETLFMLKVRKGKEWKWFCPSVLFFLGCTVPSIWFLELHELERRLAASSEQQASEQQGGCRNTTTNVTEDGPGDFLALHYIGIDAQIEIENWIGGLEQIMVLLLVIGRWLLPRGKLTRDELSQLLLVYIAMAADIVELFDVFDEERVGNKRRIVYGALVLFSWSLLQFTIVLTAVRSRKDRPGAIHASDRTLSRGSQVSDDPEQPPLEENGQKHGQRRGTLQRLVTEIQQQDLLICGCCHPDIFATFTTIIMQDGPFLAFRLYLMFYERVLTQGVLFFVGKNALIIVLQIYRVIVICTEKKKSSSPAEGRELADVKVIMRDERKPGRAAAEEKAITNDEIKARNSAAK